MALLMGTGAAAANHNRTIIVLHLPHATIDPRFDEVDIVAPVYEVVTERLTERFVVLARGRTGEMLRSRGFDSATCGESCELEAARLIGAAYVFAAKATPAEESLAVSLQLIDVTGGALVGMKRVTASDEEVLNTRIADAIHTLIDRLDAHDQRFDHTSPANPRGSSGPLSDEPHAGQEVLVSFHSTPAGAKVFIDGEAECQATPCSRRLPIGSHEVAMVLPYHVRRRETITVTHDWTVDWQLRLKPYHYLLMNEARFGGSLVSMGFAPHRQVYKRLLAIEGYRFAGLHPVIDTGLGGNIFGYRRSAFGASWSIFGIGPVLRLGRLIIHAQLQLLSFRHRSGSRAKRWFPGLTASAVLPLLNVREIGAWAAFLPAPSAGIDVWLNNDLNHDETGFWIGLAIIHHVDF